jgi:hypothetical protein
MEAVEIGNACNDPVSLNGHHVRLLPRASKAYDATMKMKTMRVHCPFNDRSRKHMPTRNEGRMTAG